VIRNSRSGSSGGIIPSEREAFFRGVLFAGFFLVWDEAWGPLAWVMMTT